MKTMLGLVLVATLSAIPSMADAEAASDVTLFAISKSENRNQVVYAVHVDADCRPTGAAPVHAHWQNLEQGPTNTSPLLWIEQRAYGVASQQVEPLAGEGSQVRLRLRALPERPIVVHTSRSGGTCVAQANTTVAATPVSMFSIYAQLGRVFGVESVTLSGRRADTGAVVRETLKP